MRAAIVGTGQIAQQHLRCLQQLPRVNVVGVCDLSPAMAQLTAERFKIAAWYDDYEQMLRATKPDVVHVTTPVTSHLGLSLTALDCGAHVFVEKPVTTCPADLLLLLNRAESRGRVVVEDYNYIFNEPVRKILDWIASGEFGTVTHVEVMICLDIFGAGSAFADRNCPHPAERLPGGPVSDFLPHLASLAYWIAGSHHSVSTMWNRSCGDERPYVEMQSIIRAERATAALSFSSRAQPDTFWLRVHGTKMRAAANLFESRLTVERLGAGAKPLVPLFNGLREAKAVRRAAVGGLWRKLSGGPGAYSGLWKLLSETYQALETNSPLPVSTEQIRAVNRLVADLTNEEYML